MKTKIHFEEFLKKDVLREENVAVSVLNVYKQAIENRYNGIWLPENHRSSFLAILRRIRSHQKPVDAKTNNSKRGAIEACENSTATASQLDDFNRTMATASTQSNERV